MIFATYFISAICFPSLIVYKPLPGKYFDDLEGHKNTGIAWLGTINVGSYLIFNGLGALVTPYITKSDSFTLKHSYSACIILVEAISCSYIIWVTVHSLTKSVHSNLHDSLSLVTMFGLAFLHGFTSTYFMTWKPDLDTI